VLRIFCLLTLLIAASGCAATAPNAPSLFAPASQAASAPTAPPSQAKAQAAAPAPAVKKPAMVTAQAAPTAKAPKLAPKLAMPVAPASPPPAATAPSPPPPSTPAEAAPPTPPPAASAPETPAASGSSSGIFAALQDYWYAGIGLLVLLLLLVLWLLTRKRGSADRASGPPEAAAKSAAGAPAGGGAGANEPPFARAGISVGKGSETCVLRFVNQGRDPAMIESKCLAMAVERALPPMPSYPSAAVERLASPSAVDAKQQFAIERPNKVSDQDWERVQRGEAALWLYGYFDYRDSQQILRRQGFCYAYLPPAAASIPPGTGRAVAAGPPAYSYSRLAS
jgi:hypothetical protein